MRLVIRGARRILAAEKLDGGCPRRIMSRVKERPFVVNSKRKSAAVVPLTAWCAPQKTCNYTTVLLATTVGMQQRKQKTWHSTQECVPAANALPIDIHLVKVF